MRFHAEHRINGSKEAVAALLVDSSFYLRLALPDLSLPEVVEEHSDGNRASLRLRYEFVGSLDPIAQRLLGSSRLAWVQEMQVDTSAGTGTLTFEAEKDPRRLHGTADFVLAEAGGATLRRIDGELVVAVPGIGRMAERRIVPGLLRRMDIEAEAMDGKLGGGD
ncbi:MAG TPA: DUF2505 family protein [Acidimicrobiales bacterium]|nr:DUF2505 family protein [Acidimicrobiales bacterium]